MEPINEKSALPNEIMSAQQVKKPRKTRVAKWQTCEWCSKRGIVPPFKSGKNKTFVKHCVQCEATIWIRKPLT